MEMQQILNLGVGAVGMFFMYKLYMKTLDNQEKLGEAIDKNTEMSREAIEMTRETKEFLVNLNGSLKRVVKVKQKKAKE